MKLHQIPVLLALSTVAGACEDADNGLAPQQQQAQVRVVNALASSQNVDLFVNGERVGTQSFAFGSGSTACFEVPSGSRTVEFRTAGSSTVLARVTPNPNLGAGTSNTVVVAGAGANARALVVADAFTPTSGEAGIRIIHASPALGRRDVFVTAPGVTISGDPTFSDVEFGSATQFRSIAAGDIRLRFTNPGSTVVAFDGNGSPPFSIPANQARTFVVTDVAGGGPPASASNVITLQACP